MDFNELEAIEGLRWSWHSWPTTKSDIASLVIPVSIMCTPLMQSSELPILPYDPLLCSRCGAALNPYARVDYTSRIWFCPFCLLRNPFPVSYSPTISESNLPAELFPTYSSVEYVKDTAVSAKSGGLGSAFSSSSTLVSLGSGVSVPVEARGTVLGPALVFLVDGCIEEDELRVVKSELLLVVEQLPEIALVGLIVFDSMVKLYDLGFSECLKIVLLRGEQEVSCEQVNKICCIQVMIITGEPRN